jgi:cobyrinic acid a,c-diamide synthase
MAARPGVLVAATSSDCGKTTVVLGLIAALRRRGMKVQPFKVGPDYIDPGHHSVAASRPSHNLDGWMIPEAANLEIFQRASASADLAVVEGVMGLFDGLNGTDQSGSSAQMAAMLGLPVILVVDARAVGRSAAATVWGFSSFDPDLHISGVIFNNVGGPSHEEILRAALASRCDLPCLGCLGNCGSLHMEDRHLGLVTAAETSGMARLLEDLARVAESRLDLSRIIGIAATSRTPGAQAASLFPGEPARDRVRLAVAMDKAFTFYYQANLDLLEHAGADIVPFSPLEDTSIPEGAAGLYIGGGYPELFASELAGNRPMLESIASRIARGMPAFAECGGFMYLCQTLKDVDGREHRMVGAITGMTRMTGRLQALGYIELTTLGQSPLGRPGSVMRGHEYRWSKAELAGKRPAYRVERTLGGGEAIEDGYASGNVIAGYQHIHFASNPASAFSFVESMRNYKEEMS